jgi:hypothetical protein
VTGPAKKRLVFKPGQRRLIPVPDGPRPLLG